MKILNSLNWPISLSVLFLVSISVLVIYSSSPELAFQQGLYAAAGILIYFFISQFDYRALKTLIMPSYFITLILLLIVFIIGEETRGSFRWIPLGFINLQPSELAKPVLILLLAQFWSKHSVSWFNLGKSLLWFLPAAALVFKQPDLGTTLTLIVAWIGIVFAAGISWKKISIMFITFLVAIPLFWFTLHDYQQQRITSFLSPTSDPLGEGYNVIQSTIAVGSGEIFGRGLGRGTQSRLQFLPEFRTDFVFASIGEELGFLGTVSILAIYSFLFIYCIKSAEGVSDYFGFLIIFGILSMLMFQTVVNIGMNIGVLPITGITLPLISYGGSSLIITFFCLGLVSSILKSRKKFDINSLEG